MYAQLDFTQNKIKRVNLIGGEEVGIIPTLIEQYPNDFVNLDGRENTPVDTFDWYYNMETNQFITTAEIPVLDPAPIDPTQEREQAYRTLRTKEDGTPLISYAGATYTCDEAYAQIKVYEQEDQFAGTTKAQELGRLWVASKEYIRKLYISEGGPKNEK